MTKKSDIIHLINQARAEARSEGFKNFLNKNYKLISSLVIIGLVIAVIFLIFSFYQNSQQKKFSEILHQSLISQQTGNVLQVKENLQKIYQSKLAPSGVWSLGSLRYAALLLNEGKKSEATKIYQEIHDCRFCDAYIKDLAGLLLVKIWMSDEFEIAKDDLSLRIEKIEKSGKVLKYQIAEQRALLEMQKNNLEKSYQIFDSMANSVDISPTLKSRAQDGLKMVLAKGYEPKK